MSIFRLSISTIKRSEGRSAVAAAAYRSGSRIVCERTGRTHDFRTKGANGVIESALFGWTRSRAELWNACEQVEKRKDAQVCRDIVIALPAELSPTLRSFLAHSFADWVSAEYSCVVDMNIHRPSKNGDRRQHHFHLLMPTREVSKSGQFGKKIERLGFAPRAREEVELIRTAWAAAANAALTISQSAERLDNRSYARQGQERQSTHLPRGLVGSEPHAGSDHVAQLNRLSEAKHTLRKPIAAPAGKSTGRRPSNEKRSALTEAEKEAIRAAIRDGAKKRTAEMRTNSNEQPPQIKKPKARKY